MLSAEEGLITVLKENGVDFSAFLPCEKIKRLLGLVGETFYTVPLTREEEGVGICAGAALSGRRPAMFVQSSGIGNMLNALLSLTGFYGLPLSLFVSWRGIHKEKIEAQIPMGRRLPMILEGAGISYSRIGSRDDFGLIEKNLHRVYKDDIMHAFLLSPAVWEGCGDEHLLPAGTPAFTSTRAGLSEKAGRPEPKLTRFEILGIISPYLDSKAVVCNLGFPSKELFHIKHQPSNFYMLGSMGMATPIGLGIALTSGKEVVVIDGDGSLLMNPGCLATCAYFSPRNLTILAIDNGSYGSTGDQPTLTRSCVDLELVAKGFGIRNAFTVFDETGLVDAMRDSERGLRFIRALAVPGNKDVPNILVNHLEIRRKVQEFLKSD